LSTLKKMRKRKRRKNKIIEKKPIFKLTIEQFEKYKFKDRANKPVQIGDILINDFGVRFSIKYNVKYNEVTLNGYCWDCNLNVIKMLRRIE